MTNLTSGSDWRAHSGSWSLLIALVGAVLTYSVMNTFLHWPGVELLVPTNAYGGAASGPSLLLQYGFYAGLPFAFGIAGWYADSHRGLLLVAGTCSLAVGTAAFAAFLELLDVFTAYGTAVALAFGVVGYVIAIAVGMLVPLTFTLLRQWPTSEQTVAAAETLQGVGRRKIVDRRFAGGPPGNTNSRKPRPLVARSFRLHVLSVPAPVRLLAAGAAGYVLTRAFYVSAQDSEYFDLRRVLGPESMWGELIFFLLLPVSIALLLHLFGGGHNDIVATAAVAALASAYVAARQVTLLGVDMSGDWYAALIARAFTWTFASGMILPWFVSHIPHSSERPSHDATKGRPQEAS